MSGSSGVRVTKAAASHQRLAELERRLGELEGIRQAGQALQAEVAELRFKAHLLEKIHDAIIATDLQQRITAWNHAAEEMFGWKAEEVIGKPVSEVMHSDFDQAIYESARRVLNETGDFRVETTLYTRSGRPVVVEARYIALRDESGLITGYASACRDVTIRRKAEEALRQSELNYRQAAETAQVNLAKLEAVIGSMVEGVMIADTLGNILTMNPAYRALHGFDDGESAHHSVREMAHLFTTTDTNGLPIHPTEWPVVRAAQGDLVTNFEMTVTRNDTGQTWTGLYNARLAPRKEGRSNLVVVTIIDITERRKLEAEMHHNALHLEIQRLIMQNREQERLEVAQELHDGPLQEIIALNYNLREALEINAKKERLAKLGELCAQLQNMSQEIRNFCTDLRPPALAPFGLQKAILSHLDSFRNAHPSLQCLSELMEDGQALPEPVRLALFRIYQELLNNIIKHAGASTANIRFSLDEAQVELEIQDDGCGFSLPENWIELAREGHFGLVGILERAEALGGRVLIRSEQLEGTLVRVIIPRSLQPSSNRFATTGTNNEEQYHAK